MILITVGLLILIYCFCNFRKGTYLFIFYQVFWCPGMTLLKMGESTVTMGLAMSTGYLIIYVLKFGINKQHYLQKEQFPFKRPFLLLSFSYLLSCFFAVGSFTGEITRAVSIIFQELLVIWALWYVVTTEKDLKRLTKGMTILFALAGVYGLIEYALKYNAIVLAKSKYVEEGIKLYSDTVEATMRGYRVLSFFEHPIGAGMTMALFAIFILTMRVSFNRKMSDPYRLIAYVGVGLCIVCVFLSKMRSAIIFLLIGILGVIDFKKRKFWKIAFFSIVIFIIVLPLVKDNLSIIASMFNQEAAKSVGGSTISMRIEQWNAVLNLFKMSPFAGLGEKFDSVLSNVYIQQARGFESIWFLSLARHGIVGTLGNIYLLYYSIIKIPREYSSKQAMFLGLAFWITNTITTIPSFRLTLYYLLYFYFIRIGKMGCPAFNTLKCTPCQGQFEFSGLHSAGYSEII